MGQRHPSHYRPDIDGLRAIAVLSVIFYHAHFIGFNGGFVGVDVFFVISGFLITSFLVKQVRDTGSVSFLDFYAKRVRRLFPAIFVVVLSVLLVWGLFLMGVQEDTNVLVKSVRYSVFGLANVFFQKNTGGYFNGFSDEMPLLHFWSLGVEEQFYLIWPLLVLLAMKRSTRTLVVTLSSLGILSFIFSLCLMAKQQHNWAFYSMPARAWELSVGALLVFVRPTSKSRKIAEVLGWAGLAAVAVAVVITRADRFPGVISLLPVLGAAMLIASGLFFSNTSARAILSTRPMVKVGILSYGMYLWHWPMFAMAKVVNLGDVPPLWFRVLVVFASAILAQVSLKWVEEPVRFGKFFDRWSSKKIIIYGLLGSLAIASIAMSLRFLEVMRANQNRELIEMISERSPLYAGCGGYEAIGNPLCIVDYSNGHTGKNHLLLWGSSHAGTIFPMIEDYARKTSNSAGLIDRGGGPNGLLYDLDLFMVNEVQTAEMLKFGESVIADLKRRIVRGEKISVILMPRWMQYSAGPTLCSSEPVEFLDRGRTLDGTLSVIKHAVQKTLTALASVGVSKVLIVLPYPEYKYNVLRCFGRSSTLCATPRSTMDSYRKPMVDVITNATRPFSNVRLIDPVTKICNDKECPQVIEIDGRKIPVVVDDDHPSGEMGRILGARIKTDLDWLSSP